MKIRKTAFSLPSRVETSATLSEWSGLRQDFISQKIGVQERRFLPAGERPVDLAASACERLFAAPDGPAREAIDLVVVVTQNPDYRIPHSSALLQDALQLRSDIAAFDIGLGCSGYVYALAVLKGLMMAEGMSDALLVTCDPYSRIMGRSDRETVALFGDAATATWMSADQGGSIGKVDFGTDGAGAENLIIRAGGSAHSMSGIDPGEEGVPERDFRLYMNGRGIFNFMMERIPKSIETALQKNDVSREDIDFFVFHQASRFLLDQLSSRLGIEREKVPCNLERYGNTVSSSIPLLLSEMQADGRLPGKKVLVSGFGVGLSWATTVLQF
ncbi:ketoacyl-ACP synthase III [Bradyrhizobium sp. HKCCYLS2038]|uniref:ketoacyl-ACP synthase III n=1 Tax=unclassified Bradyrhizobium TaxID=2631580 RepID=UPI003EBBD8FA